LISSGIKIIPAIPIKKVTRAAGIKTAILRTN
jgi:hypothetical protein